MDWLDWTPESPTRRRRRPPDAPAAALRCRHRFAALAVAALLGPFHVGGLQAQAADYTVLSVPADHSLGEALAKAEELLSQPSPVPVAIEFATGVHYLAQTVQLGPAFSGGEATPFVVRAAADAAVVISGGERLETWRGRPMVPAPSARQGSPARRRSTSCS